MNIKEFDIERDVSLSRHTTFRIGGNAKYFFEADNKEDVKRIVEAVRKDKIPFLVLGNGSNMLVSDDGFDGLVIKMSGRNIFLEEDIVIAEPGVLLLSLASFCLRNELSGLEWAAGIPGTTGGAVRGNAGAFGGSMADIVVSVEAFNITNGKIEILNNEDCKFDYRESVFKKNENLIILEIKLRFKKEYVSEIKERIDKYIRYRKERHPGEPSAGSVFKGHYMDKEERVRLTKKFPLIKEFEEIVPAAFLIDQCGLKGEMFGGAMISPLHPNFIINVGGAKASDVRELISLIKKNVTKKFEISLEEEIQYIGFQDIDKI